MQNEYTQNVDFEFLAGMGIHVLTYQPGQLGLLYPEWDGGKFVWYPDKGTLMVELGPKNARKLGEYHDTEEMYNAMRDFMRASKIL